MLRVERRMSVFVNRVLRRIFGLKRDAVKASGENYIMRSLVISAPHPALCVYKIQKNEICGSYSAYGKGKSMCGILVWKPEGRNPLGRIRRRWENSVTIDLCSTHIEQR